MYQGILRDILSNLLPITYVCRCLCMAVCEGVRVFTGYIGRI